MGEAFKCDFCGEFHEGRPAKTLYEKEHSAKNETFYNEYAALCENCHDNPDGTSERNPLGWVERVSIAGPELDDCLSVKADTLGVRFFAVLERMQTDGEESAKPLGFGVEYPDGTATVDSTNEEHPVGPDPSESSVYLPDGVSELTEQYRARSDIGVVRVSE